MLSNQFNAPRPSLPMRWDCTSVAPQIYAHRRHLRHQGMLVLLLLVTGVVAVMLGISCMPGRGWAPLTCMHFRSVGCSSTLY